MKYDMVKIGDNIRRLRKQMGISIKVLGERTGISSSFIGLTERGQKGMSTEKLCRIADALNVTLNELIEGEFSGGKVLLKVSEEGKINLDKQIIANLSGLSDEQKEFVLYLIKGVRNNRKLLGPNEDADDSLKYD